jgi:hypothetical protein
MNSYLSHVKIKDHITFLLAGRLRPGIVEALRHHHGPPESLQAAVQPAAGGPRIWLDVNLLAPLAGTPHAREVSGLGDAA